MRKVLTGLTAAALFTLTPGLVDQALAHGGAYRGPGGEVPPNSRDPHDPPPPPPGGGPSTPPGEGEGPETGPDVGDGPETGPDDGGGPETPPPTDGGPDTTGPDSTGPTTGPGNPGPGRRRAGPRGPGYEDWKFWWNYNKDEILQLKSELKKRQNNRTTGSDRVFGSDGSSIAGVQSTTDAAIQNQIVPALRKLLAEDDLNFDIRSASAIALAKIGDETIVPTLKAMALNEGRGKQRYHRIVVESSALAMGLLQMDTPDVRDFLVDLVESDHNSSFVRPFAAVSLGLLGQAENPQQFDRDRAVSEALFRVLAGDASKPDVKPAALLALGLLENDANVPALMEMVTNGRVRKGADELSDTEKAFAIQALGKIGMPHLDGDAEDGAVVELLRGMLQKKAKVSTNESRSAAIALGQIAPQCSEKTQGQIIQALKTAATKAKDSSVANFAMISMGRIGATEGIPEETRTEAIETLRHLLDKASPSSIKQPFAALSLGLIGRAMLTETGTPPEERINRVIREKFEETRNPSEKGGYAIASGLLRDPLAVGPLVEILGDKGAEKKLRGYSAVALGMIGDTLGGDAIKETLADSSDRELRVQTAVAAGLIGDSSVIQSLVDIMSKGEESQYILGSVALALGQIGDERAVAPLLAISVDEEEQYPELTRALATVALGQIGDRRDLPVLTRVAKDVNYRAHVPALAELLTIL